jgi:biotin synthase
MIPQPNDKKTLDKRSILAWLLESDSAKLGKLWQMADETRQGCVGDEIWLRGLVEISNHCTRRCAYCGISAHMTDLKRYRLSIEEILQGARMAVACGFGTIVLQSGEDPGITGAWLAKVIRSIKAETGLTVTLSLGERSNSDLQAWRDAGADRYLLRFETSDSELYKKIHPSQGNESDRLGQLRRMKAMGFEIGAGVMVGIPGQTYESLANDIWLFRKLGIHMIGIGPYLKAPGTPLAGELGESLKKMASDRQVPADAIATLKTMALARLLCPYANIPATTALAAIDPAEGRAAALRRGANVVMPNLTPHKCQELYAIYPDKTALRESAEHSLQSIEAQIRALGRSIGLGPGQSRAYSAETLGTSAVKNFSASS